MKGFEKILRGILKYRATDKHVMEKRFKEVCSNPSVSTGFFFVLIFFSRSVDATKTDDLFNF